MVLNRKVTSLTETPICIDWELISNIEVRNACRSKDFNVHHRSPIATVLSYHTNTRQRRLKAYVIESNRASCCPNAGGVDWTTAPARPQQLVTVCKRTLKKRWLPLIGLITDVICMAADTHTQHLKGLNTCPRSFCG